MNPRKFALCGGIIMLVMGAVSMIPALVGSTEGLPFLNLDTSYGSFLNLFPMNIVNKVLLVLFGVAGIWASRSTSTSLPRSILFSRTVFFAMGIAALLGFFPQTNTLFGYWPLFGYEAFAHLAFSVMGLYFGFALTQKAEEKMKHNPTFRTAGQEL